VKKKVVVLAIDDGPHLREDLYHNGPKCRIRIPLVGVVCKGLQLIHVGKTDVEVDGLDSTEKIIELYQRCPFKLEIRLIMIDSPTVAAFNIVDPFRIHQETGVPVLLLPDSRPRGSIVDVYSKVFPDRNSQIEILQNLPPLDQLELEIHSDPNIKGSIYFHVIGAKKEDIAPVLIHLAEYSLVPEPLRLAHLLASGELVQ
jgi:endonuclease V-like protein UPF0215 family